MIDISNTAHIIDVRDITDRVKELRGEITFLDGPDDDGLQDELATLDSLLEDLRGNGGDHQWEGAWYPVSIIRDDYFEDYARQLAEDIGAIPDDARWPCTCIDWKEAARELRMDYSSVDYGDVTYWYR